MGFGAPGAVVVVVVVAGRVVVVVVGTGAAVVGAGRVVVVVVGAVVVMVVAGRVVVVVSCGDVEVVVALVVVVTAVVVVARVVSAAAVEVGLEDGVGGSGGVIVVAEVIDVLEAGGSARTCVSSDPVRHAPRSNGTTTTAAVSFFLAISRSVELFGSKVAGLFARFPPLALDEWSWPPSG